MRWFDFREVNTGIGKLKNERTKKQESQNQ